MQTIAFKPGHTFPTRLHLCPAENHISLRIHAGFLESSQAMLWVAKDPKLVMRTTKILNNLHGCAWLI